MSRKSYPFGRRRKGGSNSSSGKHPLVRPPHDDNVSAAVRLPVLINKRVIYLFHDNQEMCDSFLLSLNQAINYYLETTKAFVPAVNLEIHRIALADLEEICREEICDTETFVACHLLEIYKVCPGDIVIAAGKEAQKLIRELKQRALDRPDQGKRFLTQDDALKASGHLPLPTDETAAHLAYNCAIIKRIYDSSP